MHRWEYMKAQAEEQKREEERYKRIRSKVLFWSTVVKENQIIKYLAS